MANAPIAATVSDKDLCSCRNAVPHVLCSVCKKPFPANKENSRALPKRLGSLSLAVEATMREAVDIMWWFEPHKKDVFEQRKEAAKKALCEALDEFFMSEIEAVEEETREEERRKRHVSVVTELAMTEDEYLRDLNTLLGIWQPRLQQEGVLSAEESHLVFLYVKEVQMLSAEIQRALAIAKEQPEEEQRIGRLFCEKARFMNVYIGFCTNQVNAGEVLTTKSGKVKEAADKLRAEVSELRQLDLQSYLIKPTQRLTKYPMLLKELLRWMRDDHEDRADLKSAIEQIQLMLGSVNSRTLEQQTHLFLNKVVPSMSWTSFNRVDLILSSCKLILHDSIQTVITWSSAAGSSSTRKASRVAFFDRLVMAFKKNKLDDGVQEIAYLETHGLSIKPGAENSALSFVLWHPDQPDLSMELFFPRSATKALWLERIQEAIRDAPKQPLTLLEVIPKKRSLSAVVRKRSISSAPPKEPITTSSTTSSAVPRSRKSDDEPVDIRRVLGTPSPRPRSISFEYAPGRPQCLSDIISSEMDYMAEVEKADSWRREIESQALLSPSQIESLFRHLPAILSFSKEVAEEMKREEALSASEQTIGATFLALLPKMAIFTAPLNDQAGNLLTLDSLMKMPAYKQLLSLMNTDDESYVKDLGDLLCSLLLRPGFYLSCLTNLMAVTTSDHSDYSSLRLAVEGLGRLTTPISQQCRKSQTLDFLNRIDSALVWTSEPAVDVLLSNLQLVLVEHVSSITFDPERGMPKNQRGNVVFLFDRLLLVAKCSQQKGVWKELCYYPIGPGLQPREIQPNSIALSSSASTHETELVFSKPSVFRFFKMFLAEALAKPVSGMAQPSLVLVDRSKTSIANSPAPTPIAGLQSESSSGLRNKLTHVLNLRRSSASAKDLLSIRSADNTPVQAGLTISVTAPMVVPLSLADSERKRPTSPSMSPKPFARLFPPRVKDPEPLQF